MICPIVRQILVHKGSGLNQNISVQSVSLDQSGAIGEVDDTIQLTATVLPANATDKSVTWSSSDEAVATVSETGLVTYVGGVACTITSETTDGGFTATFIAVFVSADTTDYEDSDPQLTSALVDAVINYQAGLDPLPIGKVFKFMGNEPVTDDSLASMDLLVADDRNVIECER